MTNRAIASKLRTFFSKQFNWERFPWFFHYGVALLSVVAASSTTLLLYSLLQDTPAGLFYVAIMVSSWVGGLGPGLFTTVLSTFALNYFLLEPRYLFNITSLKTIVQLGTFATAAILISYLNESQLSAKRRADANFRSWRDSEAQFTHLAEANSIGIFGATLNGLITEANDAFLQMIGYSREDLLTGKIDWNTMTPPEYQQVSERSQQELHTTGACTPFEKEFICKDGSRVPILLGSVMRGEQSVVGFVLDRNNSKRNEAERQRAEAALRESEERLRLALTAANQGLYDLNLQTGEAVVSPEYARMLEYEPDEFQETNAKWRDRLHPDDFAVTSEAYEDYIAGRRDVYRVEFRQLTKSGNWRWILSIGKIVAWDNQGQPLRMLGTHTDISDAKQREAERKRVEEALRDREQRLDLATSVAKLGVFEWNSQADDSVWENAQIYEIFGHALEDGTLNKAEFMDQVIHPEDRETFGLCLAEGMKPNCSLHAICRIRRRNDGEWRWIELTGQCELAADDTPLRIVGVVSDISDRVQIEAERDESLRQEQAAREEAERANRIKDEFLAVLSHELRSPLNPILGWTKLMQSQQFSPEKTAQALATIERNAKLQAQLIEDLLDVSRILQGKMVLNIGSVNLVTIVEAAIETVRLAAEAKNIHIHTALDARCGTVAGDAARLQQIVWNLLTNAVKFTPQGGRVDVRLDRREGFAQIQAQDTGKGISPDFLPYVFDYFRQEDGATTRKFGGLGLGLALVRQLTEQHGGTVGVESAGEGQGATFTVRLPLQTLFSEPDQKPLPATQTFGLNNANILVVDDEADMRTLMVAILEAEGAQVKAAASATEVLTILEQWQPDVLVSDIGMPEVDGYMLLHQVRRFEAAKRESLPSEREGSIPAIRTKRNCIAIALTAYAGELDQQRALSAGFQQHLAKPIEPERLVAAISTLHHSEGNARVLDST
ncbi:MAG: PAS domain-containing protein [Phormidium tanganyikae FI6-MK23]|jgi:PAS domain S-box-containing protein|nr:PAS domain-containing protein [Phormidium tanganyikae FI6-MK23]